MHCLRAVTFRLALFTVALLTCAAIQAQTPGTGAIAGTVMDPTGAVLAQAEVTVTNNATGAARTVTTAAHGEFRVPLLIPGAYSISARSTGFEQKQLVSVQVGVAETATVELRLAIGTHNETIEVTDMARLESSAMGRAVNQQ